MLKFDVNMAKKMFFDRKAVKSMMDATTRRFLSKFGSYVRSTAKERIAKRKRIVSQPGKSPFSKTGTLKKFLFFGFDPDRRSVVIGPVRVSGKKGDAPEALEHGGRVTLPRGNKPKKGRQTEKRQADIAARPFMQPAYEKELGHIDEIWRQSIK